jgi:hypothetical protein
LESLIVNKSSENLQLLLKDIANAEVPYNDALLLLNSTYSLRFDYDRFVLSKKAENGKKPNPFEINAYLKIVRVNDTQSQIQYSVKYSEISILITIFINLILVALPFFEVRFKMVNNSFLAEGFGIKLLISILLLFSLNLGLWLAIQSKKEVYKKVIELVINKKSPDLL